MKKLIFITTMLCLPFFTYAQVGVGTTSPTSELEIETTNTGIPALELNPQTGPVGNATGQLAVIGDLLYMYDSTRSKWLSVESTALQFGYGLDATSETLWFGGDVEDSAAIMPRNGTIVYMTINSSAGNANKGFDIRINGSDVGNDSDPTLDGRVSLSSGTFSYSDYNIDFSAGDFIQIEGRGGSTITEPTAIIWVKWRQ